MQDLEAFKKAVMQAASRAFAHVKILDVQISQDHDSDGGAVLRIEIIFDGDLRKIDPRSVSGMARTLRPVLDEAGEPAFPLVSLISKSDWRGEQRAS
jgi:hypothetical protein